MPYRPRSALLTAAAFAGAAVLAWLATFLAPFGHAWDVAVLQRFDVRSTQRVDELAHGISALADPAPYILFALLFMAAAFARGLPRLALVVGVVMAGSSLTTQILKPLLGADRHAGYLGDGAQIPAGSWPSGHATAAAAIALCACLVAPPRLRPFVAVIGAVLVAGVSVSLLVLGWHYPSDVIAGPLVAAAWTSAGVAALGASRRRRPARAADRRRAPTAAQSR